MDLDAVENLIKLMKTHEVSELSYQDADLRIRLRIGAAPVALAAPVAAAALPARPSSAPAPVVDSPPVTGGVEVKSPMVGTFYRSPKPDSPSFVEVGQRVRVGQVLCIIEAMKLMNELECDVDGVLVEVLATNGSPVQFGQVLFRVQPA